MSHVTHMDESRHVGMNRHTYEWFMSHLRMSHVSHMNEPWHTYERVMSRRSESYRTCMSHVTLMNESCHTYQCVTSHIWMSYVTMMNESCHTYQWVMSHIVASKQAYHICMSHVRFERSTVTQTIESWYISQVSHAYHLVTLYDW